LQGPDPCAKVLKKVGRRPLFFVEGRHGGHAGLSALAYELLGVVVSHQHQEPQAQAETQKQGQREAAADKREAHFRRVELRNGRSKK